MPFQSISSFGERTAETDLTKGNIKALRSGITFYRKLHPDLI